MRASISFLKGAPYPSSAFFPGNGRLGDNARKWNPFKDVNSWIGGKKRFRSHGDENNEMDEDDGDPDSPFLILGTSGDDTSCHPHVLSPPLMESLQAFMAESLQEGSNVMMKPQFEQSLEEEKEPLFYALPQERLPLKPPSDYFEYRNPGIQI